MRIGIALDAPSNDEEYWKTPLGDPEELTELKLGIGSAIIKALGRQMLEDSVEWFGEEVAKDIVHITLGIVGEAGEVAEAMKKVMRGSWDLREGGIKYCGELVDVLIYVLIAAEICNFDIIEGYKEKREFNMKRFSRESSTDQSTLSAEIRGQQRAPFGSSAFVRESDVQPEVRRHDQNTF